MIQKRNLGRTGLRVSELCLGTLNFGWKTDDAASLAILDAFHSAGGTFLQATAISPSVELPSVSTNYSEEVIGKWWTSRGVERRDLVLATRIDVRRARASGGKLTDAVCARVRESMRRLQTDYLDLLVLEWSEDLLPMGEALEAFGAVVHSCHVRYLATANFPAWRVMDCVSRAFQRNACRMEALQAEYSLMTRARFEPEVMRLCEELKLGFLATLPLAGGFLTRRAPGVFGSLGGREWVPQRFDHPYGDAALGALEAVAVRHGATPAQVALAWVLANPTVASAVIGVRSVAELRELVQASELELASAELEELANATAAEAVFIPPPPAGREARIPSPSGV